MLDKTTGELLPVLSDPQDIAEVMDSNLAGESISPMDLERIRIPTGGSTNWTLDTDQTEKVLEGVIIHHRLTRTYWSEDFEQSGGSNPPDCVNNDLRLKPEKGEGKPGVLCEECPMNQWGSGKNGQGKACRQSRLLFLIRPGEILPLVLAVSPGSLKAVKRYMTKLGSKKLQARHVYSRLGLEQVQNRAGIKFARILPLEYEVLSQENREQADSIYRQLQPLLDAVPVEREDVDGPPPEPYYGHHIVEEAPIFFDEEYVAPI